MSTEPNPRFELRRVTSIKWLIEDLSLPESHPERVVAHVYEVDDLEYDVVWLRDLGLAEHFMCPSDVLDAVIDRVTAPRLPAARRPIPIPHLPPIRERILA
ncbi:hypothetical protein [Microbacterium trichothecenolyticum]|uniref:hypothetical protein n=2 Tax=Microbacterium TaxID=33882 RepID=UPI000A02148D|nr:hypothetical protein [Microbacterium trichothecenolyticum]